MKTPILFNAEPIKTDAKPFLVRGPYDVYVGTIDEDKLPMYVIINRSTGVVEFTTEVTGIVNDWLDHFVKETATNQINEQFSLGLNS